MEPDRRNRVSDLYHRALDQPPDTRGAYLDEACNGDAVLRAEVESLLRYESGAADFLERPAAAAADGTLVSPPARPSLVNRQLGPYTILAPLGAGGMGEVYRARDSKLGREVAIKLLPAHLTVDPERRGRFAREARLLATVNHPHIGAIYGLEEADGVTALILELVEGPTLADRLERGALPVAQALTIARQIADALDAAHQTGMVHRDLKPANVVLQGGAGSDDVRVKLLDFGLAKTMAVGLDGDLTQRPPGSFDGTVDGRILGTPAYMSPEQARGLPVDKRTDIWAFGCVLFEMLSGRPPFAGETITDTFAHILEREPDWAVLPVDMPASVRLLLHRCLRKDPQKRLHDIADARIELDETESAMRSYASVGTGERSTRDRFGWIVASTVAVALMGAVGLLINQGRGTRPAADPVEFTVGPPEDWRFTADAFSGWVARFAIAPDGRHMVAVAYSQGVQMLWVRSTTRPPWRRLEGTEGAGAPFWSPDSASVGFFANNELKTVAITGELPVVLCPAPQTIGTSGAWNREGVIIFGGHKELQKINESGGIPTSLTTLVQNDVSHLWPSFLPDDQHFVYNAQRPGANELRLGSLTSTETITIGAFESNAVAAADHLFFVRGGRLVAQSFDIIARQLTGTPIVLAEDAAVVLPRQHGAFSVSASGVLAYSRSARAMMSQLTWMDRDGQPLGTAGDPGFYINIDLSWDDRYVAVSQMKEQPGPQWNVDIWLLDLARAGTAKRLTDQPSREFDPAWSRDGRYVAFHSVTTGRGSSLYRRPADDSGKDELLVTSETAITAPEWSPDGRLLVYSEQGATTGFDLWIVSLTGERKKSVLLDTAYDEASGAVSPDGRWIAYQSTRSGRSEVYVRRFPVGDEELPISRDGGRAPRWRRNGRELFFLSPSGTLMAVGIDTNGRATVPYPLFQTGLTNPATFHPYAVASDGQRFLMPVSRQSTDAMPITVVLHWPALLAE